MSHNPSGSSVASALWRRGAMTFGTTALLLALRVLKNVVITRILGPVDRGIFGVMNLIPDLLVTLGSMGFGNSVTYYVARERYDLRKVTGGIFIFSLVMGSILIMAGSVLLRLNLIFPEHSGLINRFSPLILASIPLFLLKRNGVSLLTSLSLIGSLNLSRFIEVALPFFLFLGLWLIWDISGLASAAWSWFAGVTLAALVPFLAMRGQGCYPPAMTGQFIKKGMAYGVYSHVGSFFHLLLLRIDFLFISLMLGPAELGYYAVATSFAEILVTIPESVVIPYTGMVMSMESSDSVHYTPLVAKSVLVVMTGLCLTVALAGKFLIRLLFGPEFLPAYESTVLLMPGMISLSIFYIIKTDLLGRKMPGRISIMTTLACLVNIALNFLTIPSMGINAAAMNSSIAYTLSMLLILGMYVRASGNSVLATLIFSRAEMAAIVTRLRLFRAQGYRLRPSRSKEDTA